MSELEDGLELQREAMADAEKIGWTDELKEKYVVGVGMELNASCGDSTILQHCFIHEGEGGDEAWEEYAGETWKEYINSEFECYKPEVE